MKNEALKVLSGELTKKHKSDAGWDIHSEENYTLPIGGRHKFSTGLVIAVPENHKGQVCNRSGLSARYGLMVFEGTVDPDYRGEVFVTIINLGQDEYTVSVGDRIAQLVLQRVNTEPFERVDRLPDTNRGSNGFGSTGI